MSSESWAVVDGIIAGVVLRNEQVLLTGEVPSAMLDGLAARLAARRSRVLRPSTADALTLPQLLTEIVGLTPGETLEAPDLERGFELLTDGGPGWERVVLLLDRADALDPAALRYLQMLVRDAPLQLLFVGGPKLYGLLMQNEFGALRHDFATYAIDAPAVVDAAPTVVGGAPLPARRGRKLARPGRWLVAGASVAASVAGVLWLMYSGVLAGNAAYPGPLAAVYPVARSP